MRKDIYPHSVKEIKLIETHISWVILTGKYVYKIKKAIDLGFINTLSLNKRIAFCEEEIRLNRRLTPNLYLGIAKIYGSIGQLKISTVLEEKINNDDNDIIEVAVVMKQFDNSNLLSNNHLLENVPRSALTQLANRLGNFHLSKCQKANSKEINVLNNIKSPVEENFRLLSNLLDGKDKRFIIAHYKWVDKYFQSLAKDFELRISEGAFRECHGDIHLGNIFLDRNQELKVFDSIDFSKKLRFIDPISEIAFLVMDLSVNKDLKTSFIFLNSWLRRTGDYHSLNLLKWYISYRAMVCIKVIRLKTTQAENETYKETSTKRFRLYINRLKELSSKSIQGLIIMHGLSGSGKSFVSKKISEELSAIRISSDLERHRIHNYIHLNKHNEFQKHYIIPPEIIPDSDSQKYSLQITSWLYEYWLPKLAKSSLSSGLLMVVDATFLLHKYRDQMHNLALSQDVGFAIVNCNCKDKLALDRISERVSNKNEYSEANYKIRQSQRNLIEPLTNKELLHSINTDEETNMDHILDQLKSVL